MKVTVKDPSGLNGPPGGTYGQISFRRLVEQLKRAGEIQQNETVTHLEIDMERGLVRYRVE